MLARCGRYPARPTARTPLPARFCRHLARLPPLPVSGHSPPSPYSPARRLAHAPARLRASPHAPAYVARTYLSVLYSGRTTAPSRSHLWFSDARRHSCAGSRHSRVHGKPIGFAAHRVRRPSGSPPIGFAALRVRHPSGSPPSELALQQSRRFTASAAQVAQRSRVATRSALRSLKSRLKCEVEAKLIKLAKLVLEEVFGPVPCQARRVAIEAVVHVN